VATVLFLLLKMKTVPSAPAVCGGPAVNPPVARKAMKAVS